MNDIISPSTLQFLGLEPRDFSVYYALLQYEQLSVRKIAKQTNLNRGVVYNSLIKLQDMGLVKAQPTNKQLRYTAEDPSFLMRLASQKENELTYAKSDVKNTIPLLKGIKSTALGKASIGVYEGYDGITALLRDVLNTMRKEEEKLIRVYASQSIRQELYRFFEDYTKRRVRYGIYAHVIAVGEGGGESEFSERKYVKETVLDPTSYTVIYANKIAIFSISKTKEPYGVLLEDEGVVNMHKMAFQILWEKLT